MELLVWEVGLGKGLEQINKLEIITLEIRGTYLRDDNEEILVVAPSKSRRVWGSISERGGAVSDVSGE